MYVHVCACMSLYLINVISPEIIIVMAFRPAVAVLRNKLSKNVQITPDPLSPRPGWPLTVLGLEHPSSESLVTVIGDTMYHCSILAVQNNKRYGIYCTFLQGHAHTCTCMHIHTHTCTYMHIHAHTCNTCTYQQIQTKAHRAKSGPGVGP